MFVFNFCSASKGGSAARGSAVYVLDVWCETGVCEVCGVFNRTQVSHSSATVKRMCAESKYDFVSCSSMYEVILYRLSRIAYLKSSCA